MGSPGQAAILPVLGIEIFFEKRKKGLTNRPTMSILS